jgi:hypothetical protein
MNASAEDHWTEVLAGRAAPQDADARRAARARAWFEAQACADLAATADGLAAARMLARLEAVAAALRPSAAPALRAPTPNPAARVDAADGQATPGAAAAAATSGTSAGLAARAGSVVSGGRSFLRAALSSWLAPRPLAALATGLCAAVLVLQWEGMHQDEAQIKTPPPASVPSPGETGHTLIAASSAPLHDALALREELRVLGVKAQVLELGDATRVQASIDPAAQNLVQRAMNQRGWVWMPSPELNVEFQRKP